MARHVEKTRPQGAHRKAAIDESRRTIQCTPYPYHTSYSNQTLACLFLVCTHPSTGK